MDNFSDILNKLMSDPAVMNAVNEIASSTSGETSSPDELPAANEFSEAGPDISSILSAVSSLTGTNSENISSRAELLRALKPFVNPQRSSQIDKAISMLSTANAAKAALKAFGGKKLF